jgi:hypothetical protein
MVLDSAPPWQPDGGSVAMIPYADDDRVGRIPRRRAT